MRRSVVTEILDRLGSITGQTVLVLDIDLQALWSKELPHVVAAGLLVPATAATSAVCQGCESNCVMPVETLQHGTGALASFIACDRRADISRIPVPDDALRQWKAGIDLLCNFLAETLGVHRPQRELAKSEVWEVGILEGGKQRRMVRLRRRSGALELTVDGESVLPMKDALTVNADGCGVDVPAIRRLVATALRTESTYEPNVERRQERKQRTLEMREAWRAAYRASKAAYPDRPDTWHAKQIFNGPSSAGKSQDTIRKNMK